MPKKVTKKEEEKAIRIGDDMQDLVDSMNTKYGQGTIVGGHTVGEDIETVSTGSLTLDVATGVGGNPVGRLIEIFGLESCGKSTLCLHFIKEFQKAGKKCAIQDNEHSFDRKYATAIGVNVDDLIFAQSGYMEQAYNVIYDLVDSGQFGLIVIDSHTAMRPKRTVEGEIGDALMGVMSKINSEALRKIHPILRPKGCSIIAVAQLRADIGAYGDPLKPTGGYAYKFYSDMRYKVTKKVNIEKGLNSTVVEVVKNKCSSPFRKGEFSILWGKGIDRDGEIISLAAELGIFKLAGGGWYTIPDGTKIQGDEKMKEFLNDNPEFKNEVEQKVIEIVKAQ